MDSSESVQCGPCQRGKVKTKAEIWCYNCNEGFCSTCTGQHKKFKPTGDHKTIDIKSYKPPIGFIKTECDKHNQQFNLYCPIHLLPCCEECISNHHSKCSGIKSLANVAEEAKTEQSKSSVDKDITSILLLLNKMANEKLRNIIKGEQQHKNIKESTSKIREEINKHLDHLETKLYKEADTLWSEEKSNLTDVLIEIEQKKNNLKEIQDNLHTVSLNKSKLQSFLGIHQIEQKVQQFQYAVDMENDENASEVEIKINQNDEIKKILREVRSVKSFGEVKALKSRITMRRETSDSGEQQVPLLEQSNINNITMNIKTTICLGLDKNISDMICLMDGRILIVESFGKVNLLTSDGILQKQLPIPAGVFNVIQINQDTIAITYPHEKVIEIFNMENETVTKAILLHKICCGLSFSNNSLVVGLLNDEIRIVDLEGNTLKSIHVQSKTKLYHLVYLNNRVIYSDMVGRTVSCVDESGTQIWQYTHDLAVPRGLCSDTSGNIIIVDYYSVIVISKDGKDGKTLLGREGGLEQMNFICFENDESYGIVCDSKGFILTKFNLTYE